MSAQDRIAQQSTATVVINGKRYAFLSVLPVTIPTYFVETRK